MAEQGFRIIEPAALPVADRSIWIALLTKEGWRSPLLHPDFALMMAQCRSDTRIIIGVDRAGKHAFLPVQLRPGSVCRPIGAAYSDLHDLVAEDGCTLSAGELLQGVGLKSYRFFAFLSEYGSRDGEASHYDARLHDGAAFEQLRAKNAKSFKKFGRLARKLEREVGEVELRVDDRDSMRFDQLMQWKQTQFARTGRHNVLAPEWAARMMRLSYADRSAQIAGRLITLVVDGQLLAAEFGLFGDGIYHPWIAAYNDDYSRYSPGILLMYHLFENMPNNGIWRYDLGRSGPGYKSAFSNVTFPTYRGSFGDDDQTLDQSLIGRLSNAQGMVGKIGRRWEQIVLCEMSRKQQAVGLLQAARKMF
jgi:CelD/BcsL family acetyltransferase involved in cellulose biosynthesis